MINNHLFTSLIAIVFNIFIGFAASPETGSPPNNDKITYNCTDTFTAGYTYNFDSSTIDECWTLYEYPSISSTTYFYMIDYPRRGDTGYSVGLQDDSYVNSNAVMMVSPRFTDMSRDKKIEFYVHGYGGGLSIGTMSDPNDPNTFNLITDEIAESESTNEWEKRSVYFPNYNGTDQYIAFRFKRESFNDHYNVYIDDFSYQQSILCDVPEDFSVSNVMDYSVDLSWSQTGEELYWEVEYFRPDVYNSEQTIQVNSNAPTLTGLYEGTQYGVRVRAKCDDEDLWSFWTNYEYFTTTCQPGTAGYFESFEYDYDGNISPCWSKIVENTNVYTDILSVTEFEVNYSSNFSGFLLYEILPITGDRYIHIRNTYDSAGSPPSDLYLISRPMDDLDSNKRIRFNLITRRATSANSGFDYNGSSINVGTMSDPNDISTFNLIQTITPEEMSEFIVNGRPVAPWKEHTIYFNNFTGNDTFIAIQHDDAIYGCEFFIEDFIYENIPSCPEPLYPTVLDERYDAVDITWETFEGVQPQSWQIEYGFEGFAVGSGTRIDVGADLWTLTNLMDDTNYDYYVRAVCGGDFSEWSVKGTFKTKCTGYEVGYFEDFESHIPGFVENCWTGIKPTGTGLTYWDESLNNIAVVVNPPYESYSGSQSIRHFNEVNHPYHDAVSDQIVLVSPRLIDLNNYKKISFQLFAESSAYASPDEIIIGTLSDPDDYTTFTPFYTITNAYLNEDEWQYYEIDFSNYYLEDEYIGIKQAAINERQEIFFDDFMYSENDCVTPTSLTATQSGEDEVTVGWQDNNTQQAPENWEVEYGPVGFEPGTGTVVEADSNPFAINGLEAFNDYEFYVRAHCGNSIYSNWSLAYAFTMTCEFTAPFYENFDQYDASYQNYTSGIPDFCWTRSNRNVSGILDTEHLFVRQQSLPNVAFVNFYNSNNSPDAGYLVSPFLSDFDNTKILKIWVRNETSGEAYNLSGLIVGTMSNPLDRSTFTPYLTIEAEAIPLLGKEFFIDFSGYTGNDHHIAFMHDETNDYSEILFDDISYKTMPTCLEPIDVHTESYSSISAIINWEDYTTDAFFEIEYGESGFTQGTGTIEQVTGTAFEITDLNPETSYQYYVRSNCGASGTSEWVGPKQFTTTCIANLVPWEENFDSMSSYGTGIFPDCMFGDAHWVSSSVNINDYLVGDGDTSFIYVVYDDYDLNNRLTTPMLYLEAGTTYNFVFKMRKEPGDYSYQSARVYTGMGNTPDVLTNFLNYFSEFSFGFNNYHPIETTFTPIVSGDYAFSLDIRFSSIVSTIAMDSFSIDYAYGSRVLPPNDGQELTFDFEIDVPESIILEETENSTTRRFTDDNSETSILMKSNDYNESWIETNNNDENWIANQSHISKINFEIDAINNTDLYMSFDLKQKFIDNPNESLFRIVINGEVLNTFVSDGNEDFRTYELNLSDYAGEMIRVSMQQLSRTRGNNDIEDSAYLDNLTFSNNSLLSVDEQTFSTLKLYPNPVTETLYLKNSSHIDSLTIYNIMGQEVYTKRVNDSEVSIDFRQFPTAIYFVKLIKDNSEKTIKIIKN